MLELDLQMFAEGGGDGGAGGSSDAGAAPQQAATGVTEADAALQNYRQYKKTGKLPAQLAGKEQQPAERPASAAEPAQERDYAQEFDQLIKGEYKDVFGKRVQAIVQDRLKNAKGAEESLQKLTPVLEAMYRQYGVEEGDIDGLVKHLTDDDSLYEQEALEKGIPVDVLKQMKANEYQLKQLQAQAEYRQQQEQRAQQDALLDREQAEMRKIYPNFDIREELYGDETRMRQYQTLLSTGMMSVRAAYEFLNKDQLQPQMMSAIAQRTAADMARSMQAGSKRPVENGILGSAGQTTLSDDPRTWTKERLAQVKREAYAGKKIII